MNDAHLRKAMGFGDLVLFYLVTALSLRWILVLLGIRLEQSIAFARRVQPQRSADSYVVLLHLPGGLWSLLGPPILLAMAWIAMRPSRPAS